MARAKMEASVTQAKTEVGRAQASQAAGAGPVGCGARLTTCEADVAGGAAGASAVMGAAAGGAGPVGGGASGAVAGAAVRSRVGTRFGEAAVAVVGVVPALVVRDLHKTFAPGTPMEKKALCGIDLTLAPGEFCCIIGSNGAGKSTLFNAIAGEFMPDCGSVTLGGRDVTYQPDFKRARRISRVFQDPMRGTAPGLTVAENVALAYMRSRRGGAGAVRRAGGPAGVAGPDGLGLGARLARALGGLGSSLGLALGRSTRAFVREQLASLGFGLEDRMDTKVGLLSGGQRQAVSLLMCTIGEPDLLLLDEHTAALDPVAAERILALTEQVVRERHIATLMVTHNMQQALSVGDRTIVMDAGRIVADISSQRRATMGVSDLLALYREHVGADLASDEMLLTK